MIGSVSRLSVLRSLLVPRPCGSPSWVADQASIQFGPVIAAHSRGASSPCEVSPGGSVLMPGFLSTVRPITSIRTPLWVPHPAARVCM